MFFEQERIEGFLKELKNCIYHKIEPVDKVLIKKGDFKCASQAEADGQEWTEFKSGDSWGGKDQRYWFKLLFTIPESLNNCNVVFRIKTGREGEWDAINPQFLVYLNGVLKQGLDVNHTEILIDQNAKAGEGHRVDMHAYAGMSDVKAVLQASIAALDRATEQLYYDLAVPFEVAGFLEKEDKRRVDTLSILNQALNLLDFRRPHSEQYNESVERAIAFLKTEFYGKSCGHEAVYASCVGHTHIDVAWLWTLQQTREKVVRSFTTALSLMKDYPDYSFMASQPQLLQFLKEERPEVYMEIKERVKEGRWEIDGAMWLEADCNLVSGESLIRQILYGKRFIREEFGVDSRTLWLPDVFGYSAALPQILKKSGIRYFVTSKISWNEYNKMPYDTFMWEGIDGSEVLTYFLTAAEYDKVLSGNHRTIYEAKINPSQIMGAWRRYQQKNINDDVLVPYGYGDGGGGPTRDDLEYSSRMQKGLPGCPVVKMETVGNYLEGLEKKVAGNPKLPRWVGELYLEYHRGTYTSMARNKYYNRKSEFLMLDIERFSMLASQVEPSAAYPSEEIEDCWKTVLLNQFHDIIPGSSIKEVYEESQEQYEALLTEGYRLLDKSMKHITAKINLEDRAVIAFNPLGFDRDDILKFDLPYEKDGISLVDAEGKVYPVQRTEEGSLIAFVEGVPSNGYKTFYISRKAEQQPFELYAAQEKAGNRFFEIRLDDSANIVSIFDKIERREVLKPGTRGNVLQAFEDKPLRYDAWDINIYYQEKMWEINEVDEIRVIEEGPVRAAVRIKKKFMDSTLIQYLYIYNDIPRIDFVNEIDWKEKQILLKAGFPVDVRTDKATYDIQFGSVERPTNWNTSWDIGRFEVCAHKWADLSEDGYGVSLLNDCKYGYDIKDGVMRLSLLKSPIWPNPDADRELHHFVYSLYPHSGDWKDANTMHMAYRLNCPMHAVQEGAHEGTLPSHMSTVSVNRKNIIIDTVKKSENGHELIVRLYECHNRRTAASLSFFKKIGYACETDLEEKEIGVIETGDNTLSFEIYPHEIKTFKIGLI